MAVVEDWFQVTEFPDRVFRLREPALGPLHAANLWLLVADDGALLIDAGVGVAPLAPVIRAITDRPIVCLLTHTHYDHIGGAHEFRDRRVHALEAATLANPTAEATQWGGWLTADDFSRFPAPDYDFSGYAIAPAPASGLVAEGSRVEFGGRHVTLLHAPGHSPGLVCVLEEATGALFTSDALYDGRMFFDLLGSNRADAAASVRRLIDIDARIIHPGHFGSLERDPFRRLGFATLARLGGGG
jgi:glyoxylase-like metal-dependent hydrolase (beta-lactamase superfamily II)